MTLILLVALSVAAGCVGSTAFVLQRQLQRSTRDWARREQGYQRAIGQLQDRVMYMAGKPWGGPPTESDDTPPPYVDEDLVLFPEQAALVEEPV